METISHWINNQLSTEKSERTGDVYNPATGQVSAKVNFATTATIDAAVDVATKAFQTWRHSSLTKRTQVLFAFRELAPNSASSGCGATTSISSGSMSEGRPG